MDKATEEMLAQIAGMTEKLEAMDRAKAKETVAASREALTALQERIASHPLNTDSQKLEADVKRAVLDAERTHSAGADKLRHAVSLLRDMGYNTDNALKDDGTQRDDLIRASIEAQVYALNIGLFEIENGLKKRAENSEEFRAKYGRKRFTSSNAGKAHIYAYIYWGLLKIEGLSNEEVVAHPLYKNLSSMSDKLKTYEEFNQYNAYIHLEEWIGNAFETAVFMRNATKSVIAHFYSIASGAIAGEELRNALQDLGTQVDTSNVALWLSALSVDSIRPTSGSYQTVIVLRENIDKGLRYLNVYNTLIQMIADAIEIPELDIFKASLTPIERVASKLNEALEPLRYLIKERKTVPNEQALTTAPPLFTESALEATLEAFRDISMDAPPIPEDNIKYTERNLRAFVLRGVKEWSILFTILSRDYWRRKNGE